VPGEGSAGGNGGAAETPAASATAAGSADRLEPGTTMALVALCLGVFLIANDFTALNVAVPAIEETFDVNVDTAQWVINAYALVFGMAIVTGGRLADMFGRRKVFFIGAVIFGVFSLIGGAAQSAPWLFGSRVLMGIGGALMWPAILGMTYSVLPASRAAFAGSLILGVAGIGNAFGPLLGGFLTGELSWRWIFFLNVPIAIFAILVTAAKVKETEVEEEQRIDYGGITALSLGLLLLLLALDQSVDWGWGDWRTLAMLGASLALIAAFVVIEPRMGRNALIPSDIVRNREFTASCLATLAMSAVFFSIVLYVPQFLQKILDWTPLESGAGMLPMLGMFAVLAFAAGPLYQRLGAKLIISVATLAMAAGAFLLSLADADSGYDSLILGLAVTGIGVGLFYPSITTAAVTALDPARSSLAGGLVYMFQIAGGAVGLGLTTTIFTSVSEDEVATKAADAGSRLTESQEHVVQGVLAGTEPGQEAFQQLSNAGAERALDIVRDSFVAGIQAGFRVTAAIALAGFVIAVLFVGGRLGRHAEKADPDSSSG
jgi:EmrB/QacA subfamily drug resistance transporter